MKIRIKGNFVRYRLTRSEVEKLAAEGFISEETHFPNGVFVYTLQSVPGLDHLSAECKNNTIAMFFPESERMNWYHSERVGYSHSLLLPDGTKLELLLEKDFVCLDETVEDQSDNYPNPLLKNNL